MRIRLQDIRKNAAKLLMGAVLMICVPLQAAYAGIEKRVALVIGNGAYKSAVTLDNPVTDAKSVSAAL